MATIVVAMYQPSNNQQGLELGLSQTDLSHFFYHQITTGIHWHWTTSG